MPKKGEPASNRSAGHAIVRDAVTAFPDAPSKTLARKLYKEHPECWSTFDACYSAVRRQFGVAGQYNRDSQKADTFREPRKAGWSDVIPEALREEAEWVPFIIPGPVDVLTLSDVHIPFHAEKETAAALEWGYNKHPSIVLLNGDTVDHFPLSRFETDPRKRDFASEVKKTRFFLKGLRAAFPKARIILKKGNHEDRWERYMQMKCPELLGIPEFEWSAVFHLDEYGVELVGDCRPIRIGELNVIHGHEYKFPIQNPVLPARGYYMRASDHALAGHVHKTSQYSKNGIRGKVVSTWTTGCLCGLHPEYARLNEWNHGFAFIEVDETGAFTVDNKRIIDGKVY